MHEGAATTKNVDDRVLVICALLLAAGAIHAVAAVEHFGEHVSHGIFFVVLSALQLGGAVLIYSLPDRRWLILAAVGNLLVVAVWIVSRTAGLPIGPESWEREAVGLADLLATADELIIAVLAALQLALPRSAIASSRVVGHCFIAVGLALVLASSLSLLGGGTHVH